MRARNSDNKGAFKMRKLILVGGALAVILMAGNPAFGFTFSYYPEFGPSVFDENNNTSPINYPYDIGYLPSPGHQGVDVHGEDFDDEGLFAAFKDNRLYGALTNSYGAAAYSADWNESFQTGHLFFGFNGSYDQFALDLDDGNLYKVNTWDYITNKPGTYYDYDGGSIRNQIGAYRMSDGEHIATLTDFMMTSLPNYEGILDGDDPLFPSANRDTYVYEWAIDMSLLSSYLGSDPLTTVKFHHTLECGNDLIEREAAIPEPATLILLGAGLLGMGVVRRRRKK